MRFRKPWAIAALGAFAASAAIGIVAANQAPHADDLVVHEWGTFLGMSGSDGVTLDGMYHEEHALPAFVRARSRDQLRLPSVIIKGETPVIYFYTDRVQKTRVDVRFPKGIWTQWYPQAQLVGPQFSGPGAASTPAEGRIVWCPQIIPAGKAEQFGVKLPSTNSDALWNHARQVDAAYVRTRDGSKEPYPAEDERFLFYRGLGHAPLPVRFEATDGGTLSVAKEEPQGAGHLFVIQVQGNHGAFAYYPSINPGQSISRAIPSICKAWPMDEFIDRIAEEVRASLVSAGLYDKEARAMVNTWKTSYFRTEGTRALFVMPQEWTDRYIPMTITPKPREVVRVMVGRIELLSPEREAIAERSIRDLASPDSKERELAFGWLRDQGRYVEPIVRRVLHSTGDESIREACRKLLATDFVTELRAAIHSAADGGRVEDDPVFIRAQLSATLREMGLESEAKAEGEASLSAIRARPAPPMNHSDAREYLRAMARAQEGTGDFPGAANTYAEFIKFGSQVRTIADCRGCHVDTGPQQMSWYPGWWAGRRYAELIGRTGQADKAMADHERSLASNPDDTAARMMLAYLKASQGREDEARALWKPLIDPIQRPARNPQEEGPATAPSGL
ncbi:MAG: tetratricopeptide repeat protein [Isosphaeraceae bacterium]